MAFQELHEQAAQLARGPEIPTDRAERTLRNLGYQGLRMIRDAIAQGELNLPEDIGASLVDYWPHDPEGQDATERTGDLAFQRIMEDIASHERSLLRRFGAYVETNARTHNESPDAMQTFACIREYARDDWRQRAWDYAAAFLVLAELAGKGKRDGEGPPGVAATPAPTSAMSGEAKVLAVLVDHPDWTDTKIAGAAGVHRTTLYTYDRFVKAREQLKAGRPTPNDRHRHKTEIAKLRKRQPDTLPDT